MMDLTPDKIIQVLYEHMGEMCEYEFMDALRKSCKSDDKAEKSPEWCGYKNLLLSVLITAGIIESYYTDDGDQYYELESSMVMLLSKIRDGSIERSE